MNISLIVLSVLYVLTLGLVVFILYTKVFPYYDKKNELKDKEIKNEKYNLFMKLDVDAMNTVLDGYFETYINRYIAYKFLSKKNMYIKSEEAEIMVRDITKLIYIQISELYIFYIKMTQSIRDDDELLQYIHTKVENKCIESITNYNASMTP